MIQQPEWTHIQGHHWARRGSQMQAPSTAHSPHNVRLPAQQTALTMPGSQHSARLLQCQVPSTVHSPHSWSNGLQHSLLRPSLPHTCTTKCLLCVRNTDKRPHHLDSPPQETTTKNEQQRKERLCRGKDFKPRGRLIRTFTVWQPTNHPGIRGCRPGAKHFRQINNSGQTGKIPALFF